jgi:hypothetical protein
MAVARATKLQPTYRSPASAAMWSCRRACLVVSGRSRSRVACGPLPGAPGGCHVPELEQHRDAACPLGDGGGGSLLANIALRRLAHRLWSACAWAAACHARRARLLASDAACPPSSRHLLCGSPARAAYFPVGRPGPSGDARVRGLSDRDPRRTPSAPSAQPKAGEGSGCGSCRLFSNQLSMRRIPSPVSSSARRRSAVTPSGI